MSRPLEQAPPALAPPPGHPRFPLVDSLRAIAVLCVLLVHAAALSGLADFSWGRLFLHLNVGVTLFFVISGFLLYRPMVAARVLGAPATRGRDYARRRFLRIVPAYWAALTLLAIYPGLGGVFTDDWWKFYGLVQFYPFLYDPQVCTGGFEPCGLPQTWSLAAEVAFYAALPFLAAAAAALTRRLPGPWVRAEVALLAPLAAASALFCVWSTQAFEPGSEVFILHISFLGTFLWFALGMGAAVASVALHEREHESRLAGLVAERPLLPWLAAAGLMLLLALVLPATPFETGYGAAEQLLQHVSFGLVGLLMLLPAVFGQSGGGLPRRVLASRVLAWLGLISYGIFLWHFTVMAELLDVGALSWAGEHRFAPLVLMTLALAVPLGALSYYLLERPLLRLKYRSRRAPRPPASDPGAHAGAHPGSTPAPPAWSRRSPS